MLLTIIAGLVLALAVVIPSYGVLPILLLLVLWLLQGLVRRDNLPEFILMAILLSVLFGVEFHVPRGVYWGSVLLAVGLFLVKAKANTLDSGKKSYLLLLLIPLALSMIYHLGEGLVLQKTLGFLLGILGIYHIASRVPVADALAALGRAAIIGSIVLWLGGGGWYYESGRFCGVFNHPQILAVAGSFLGVVAVQRTASVAGKYLLGAGLLTSLFLSSSRTGILSCSGVLILILLSHIKGVGRKAIFVAALILILALQWQPFYQQIALKGGHAKSFAQSREYLWLVTLGNIQRVPFQGIGFGQPSSISERQLWEMGSKFVLSKPTEKGSTFLAVLEEMGVILGGLVLLGLIGLIVLSRHVFTTPAVLLLIAGLVSESYALAIGNPMAVVLWLALFTSMPEKGLPVGRPAISDRGGEPC